MFTLWGTAVLGCTGVPALLVYAVATFVKLLVRTKNHSFLLLQWCILCCIHSTTLELTIGRGKEIFEEGSVVGDSPDGVWSIIVDKINNTRSKTKIAKVGPKCRLQGLIFFSWSDYQTRDDRI